MKRIRIMAPRMLPVIIVMLATIILSGEIYSTMIKKEIENCWNGLSMATSDVASDVNIRFEDNLKILDLTADALLMNADLDNLHSIVDYLETVRKKTIFDRIDMLFPDERLISRIKGEDRRPADRRSYNELLEVGSHLSTRTIDPYTNKEAIYYFTPVIANDEPLAILIGEIDCASMANLFESTHYEGNAGVFLIDRRDGSYLIDKWHDSLGNIHDPGEHELLEEYKDIDVVADIMAGKQSHVAHISEMNGMVSFTSYQSVPGFPFSVALFIQEDIVFKDVTEMRKMFGVAGAILLVILIGYFIWNVYIVSVALKNREKAQRAEVEIGKNEAKSRFLSSVSHDIRTPLNGIIGMLEIIKLKENVPPEIGEALHKIDISAKYLLSLASDVLDMNELESGKLIFAEDPVDLNEIVNDVGVIIHQKAKTKGVSCQFDTSRLNHPYIMGSGVHISKILMNLATNAVKYNKENGEILVSVENGRMEKGKAEYTFVVRDTGIGMSQEFQQSMFNAFEQEAAGARTTQLGHGLGLSIVKQLVDKMGGIIEVESEKGIGTTFTVRLPLIADTESRSKGGEAAEASDLNGAKILLVEDNELNMEIANIMLTEVGAKVTQAFNGKLAVDKFRESELYNFDVILMDIMMPVMDGHEATRQIRAMKREDAKKIPIIAMTASTFSEDIKKCKDVGMNEHIGKPLDMEAVILKIAKHIRKFHLSGE